MFKYFLVLCCLNTSAQQSQPIISAAKSLHKALIQKDSMQLEELLHPGLSYGHSNGWVETKQEVLNHLLSNYLIYEHIVPDSMYCQVSKKFAIVRFQAVHEVILQGKAIRLNLHVCQVWIKSHKRWKLLARQSTKIG